MPDRKDLQAMMKWKDDRELFAVVLNADDWTPEALEVAKEELLSRKLDPESPKVYSDMKDGGIQAYRVRLDKRILGYLAIIAVIMGLLYLVLPKSYGTDPLLFIAGYVTISYLWLGSRIKRIEFDGREVRLVKPGWRLFDQLTLKGWLLKDVVIPVGEMKIAKQGESLIVSDGSGWTPVASRNEGRNVLEWLKTVGIADQSCYWDGMN